MKLIGRQNAIFFSEFKLTEKNRTKQLGRIPVRFDCIEPMSLPIAPLNPTIAVLVYALDVPRPSRR